MSTDTFDTREAYLKFRETWRQNYSRLAQAIREYKQALPEYDWEIRDPRNIKVKRRTKLGPNSHPLAATMSQAEILAALREDSNQARAMMKRLQEIRDNAKPTEVSRNVA